MSTFDLEDIIRQRRLERMQGQQHQEQMLKSPSQYLPSQQPEHNALLELASSRRSVDERRRRDLTASSLLQLRGNSLLHGNIPSDRVQALLDTQRRRAESLEQEEVLLRAIEQQSRRMAAASRSAASRTPHAKADTLALQQEVIKTQEEISQGEQRIRLLKRELLLEEKALIELIKRRRDLETGLGEEKDDRRSRYLDREATSGIHFLDEHSRLAHGRGTKTVRDNRVASADDALHRRRCLDGEEAIQNRAKRFKTGGTHQDGGRAALDISTTESSSNVGSEEKSADPSATRLANEAHLPASPAAKSKKNEASNPFPDDATASSSTTRTTNTDDTIPLTTNAETGAVSLAIPSDVGLISSYQRLVRTSLEFFMAKENDIASSTKGRKKEIFPGQVGVRCKFCANRPTHWKGRGSTYFPGKLSGVYQAAQNMAVTHLLEYCSEIPDDLKKTLGDERRNQRILDRRGGGKKYWMESCRKMGLRERDGQPGLFWAKDPSG